MNVHDERLPTPQYLEFIARMPEVCVELVLEYNDSVLLAKRTHPPAQNEWFWPGGRLYKGEALEDAARRIGQEELGIEIVLNDLLGVYSHFWDTSAQDEAVSRHTVNIVYRAAPVEADPKITLDEQHHAYQFFDGAEPGLHKYVTQYLSDLQRR